jgi:nitrile hydratase beta subunit
MNGVFDMGGLQCMGPVAYEKNEPVFHERWEGRAQALYLAMGAWHKWNIDASRHERNLIPPAEYLINSYYANTFTQLLGLLLRSGLVTQAEIDRGVPASGSNKAIPAMRPSDVLPRLAKGTVSERNSGADALYKVGQHVRALNINPTTHTRLPRYARGKRGVIERDHGLFVFPDTNAQFLGEHPQHVYSVRFTASELWGEQSTSRDAVYLDLWDGYLERA